MQTITLGAGCFWCVEAIFMKLKGVESVMSGYMGGDPTMANYRAICTGESGHAEVVKVEFDEEVISVETILEAFFGAHDPTTLNRQGNDVGTQYRSAIFYETQVQKEIAQEIIKRLDAQNVWPNPIVTEVTKASEFFPAEDFHQNYYSNNGSQAYCQLVITPKVEKFKKVFSDKLK